VYNKELSSSGLIFKYENVVDNIDNLSSFFVDCAIFTYIKNQEVYHDMLTSDAIPSTSKTIKFVYVVVNDGVEDYDFTHVFNQHSNCVINTKRLTCLDFLSIFCKICKNNRIDLSDLTLRCMPDNTYTEIIFKGNDTISSKITN
jgi:hypothetical protein